MATLFLFSSKKPNWKFASSITKDNNSCGCRADILVLFLTQDPNLLRSYVVRTEGTPLLGLLVIFCKPLDCFFSWEAVVSVIL